MIESFGIIPLRKEKGTWKVFLIQHKNGAHWGFPKGRAHGKESPLESATRELFEETGLKVKTLLKSTPFVEHYSGKEKKVTYFAALVEGDVLLQLDEIQAGEWYDLQEAEKRLTFHEAKDLLRQVYDLF